MTSAESRRQFFRARRCKYPVDLTHQTAGGLVQMHQAAVSRPIQRHNWALGPPPNSDLKIQDYHSPVLRSSNSDYRRNLRHWATPWANGNEEVKLADGTALAPPGEDATVLEAPEW